MKRLLVYSHDTFGLGNLRRTLSICEHLIASQPELNILLLSGSAVIQHFDLPERTDYIKLPSLKRDQHGGYGAKFLQTEFKQIVQLRAQLLQAAVAHFRPEVFLVDKKPLGVEQELTLAMQYLERELPETRNILLLRDVLDNQTQTINVWQKHDYHGSIARYYESILVAGSKDIFDVGQEYQFPASSTAKLTYCGYLQRQALPGSRERLRRELRLTPGQSLVLVTAGGGEDGRLLLDNYALGLLGKIGALPWYSAIVLGPEMPAADRQAIEKCLENMPRIKLLNFTQEMTGWIDAADVVVSMGGYNTVCEILSLKKRAVIVPRTHPVQEQRIRAERMAKHGLFSYLAPEKLTPETLIGEVEHLIEQENVRAHEWYRLDFGGLPCITQAVLQETGSQHTVSDPALPDKQGQIG